MTIVLVDKSQVAITILHGATVEVVPDGKKLKIDIPSVASIFNDGPPTGKQWRVSLDVTVVETTA